MKVCRFDEVMIRGGFVTYHAADADSDGDDNCDNTRAMYDDVSSEMAIIQQLLHGYDKDQPPRPCTLLTVLVCLIIMQLGQKNWRNALYKRSV